ncbi:MAG TPA: TonB-dependent receptor [Terriglobales bacterium]|nr:TonB-dependent receptor [Terriglobales bacterium]
MDKQNSLAVRRAFSFVTGCSASIFLGRDESKRKIFRLVCLMLALLAVPVAVFGQTDAATIVGTITDKSGAALSNATVTVVNVGTNAKTVIKTNAEGNYVATPLKIGNYSVAVEVQGFKEITRTGIVLQVQDRLRVDFTMQVGSVAEQVTVTGAPPLLQSESSALGDVIESKQIAELPLNGRDYTQLAALTTGVIKITESGNGLTGGGSSATNGNAGGNFAVNGTRGLLNNFILDGVDNNSNDLGTNVLKTNVDAIEEFKVQTSNYSAEFGRSGGAVINATIKSGTNAFHGTAFEFLRNDVLDSRGYFEPKDDKKAPFRQNQFGFTFGGPIKRDKLFFFVDYQGTRVGNSVVDQSTVPTLAELNGDFSGIGSTIYDPNTTVVVNGQAVRQPFPGNIIPSNRFDPIAHNLLSLYPAPNVPGALSNNYVRNDPGSINIDQGDVRSDYVINPRQQLFGRFSISHTNKFQQSPLPGLADGGNGTQGISYDSSRGLALGHTWTISPTIVNDLRGGFNWEHYANGIAAYGLNPPPPDLTVPGVPNDPAFNGLTLLQISGFRRLGYPGFAPTISTSQEVQYGDTVSIIHGKHSIKIGAQFHRSQFDLQQLGSPRGRIRFTGQMTNSADDPNGGGFPLADALLGLSPQGNISLGGTFHNRQEVYGGFIQDDLKVNSKLTLNLGVRYDYTTPLYDVNNQIANFDFATGQLVYAGKDGHSRGLVKTDKDDIAPRIGLAWQVLPHTVLRAGYGRFFSAQELRSGDPFQLYYNEPFVVEPNYQSDGTVPALTVSGGFPAVDPNHITGASVTTSAEGAESHLHSPVLDEWNLNIQHELPGNMLVEVAYVGSKATHLGTMLDYNQDPTPGPGNPGLRRPYPQFGSFSSMVNRGNSNYHSLQLKVDKRLSRGLMFLSSFTYSKSLNDQPEICCSSPTPQNTYDLSHEYGPSDFDQRLRWVTSFDYQLPVGKGQHFLNTSRAADLVLGGWHMGGIFTIHTGFYFTPQMSFDPSNTGSEGLYRTDQTCNGNLPRGQRNINNWFNINCFPLPAEFTFGNASKNGLVGPGAVTSDMSLRKVFDVTERANLEFRFELFNAFNHAVFAQPDNFIDDGPGAAGVITSTVVPQRQLQFGLKLNF